MLNPDVIGTHGLLLAMPPIGQHAIGEFNNRKQVFGHLYKDKGDARLARLGNFKKALDKPTNAHLGMFACVV